MNKLRKLSLNDGWQPLGVIIAIIAIIVSLYVYSQQKNIKALQVVILSNTSLVEIEDSITSNIKIFYEDKQINDLSLIQLKLENSGRV